MIWRGPLNSVCKVWTMIDGMFSEVPSLDNHTLSILDSYSQYSIHYLVCKISSGGGHWARRVIGICKQMQFLLILSVFLFLLTILQWQVLPGMLSLSCSNRTKTLFNVWPSFLTQQSLTTLCLSCSAQMMILAMRMCWTWSTLKQKLRTWRGMLRYSVMTHLLLCDLNK